MAIKLGLDAKLYLLSTGSRAAWPSTGSPSNLVEISNVSDVTLNLDVGEADVTTRANNGFSASAATLKKASIDFEMKWDPSDTNLTKLITAWTTNGVVALAALDQDKATTGAQGLWADFNVISFSKEEKLEDAQIAKFTVKPTYSAVAPAWVTVGAGS